LCHFPAAALLLLLLLARQQMKLFLSHHHPLMFVGTLHYTHMHHHCQQHRLIVTDLKCC
jgi:hypothetical protein